jgi:hypothetical protein
MDDSGQALDLPPNRSALSRRCDFGGQCWTATPRLLSALFAQASEAARNRRPATCGLRTSTKNTASLEERPVQCQTISVDECSHRCRGRESYACGRHCTREAEVAKVTGTGAAFLRLRIPKPSMRGTSGIWASARRTVASVFRVRRSVPTSPSRSLPRLPTIFPFGSPPCSIFRSTISTLCWKNSRLPVSPSTPSAKTTSTNGLAD